jgi:hypothetical protein
MIYFTRSKMDSWPHVWKPSLRDYSEPRKYMSQLSTSPCRYECRLTNLISIGFPPSTCVITTFAQIMNIFRFHTKVRVGGKFLRCHTNNYWKASCNLEAKLLALNWRSPINSSCRLALEVRSSNIHIKDAHVSGNGQFDYVEIPGYFQ